QVFQRAHAAGLAAGLYYLIRPAELEACAAHRVGAREAGALVRLCLFLEVKANLVVEVAVDGGRSQQCAQPHDPVVQEHRSPPVASTGDYSRRPVEVQGEWVHWFFSAAPVSVPTAPSVVCAAFSPRRKSLSE